MGSDEIVKELKNKLFETQTEYLLLQKENEKLKQKLEDNMHKVSVSSLGEVPLSRLGASEATDRLIAELQRRLWDALQRNSFLEQETHAEHNALIQTYEGYIKKLEEELNRCKLLLKQNTIQNISHSTNMKLQLKWLLTGKISVIEEEDALLNPMTTILEVKGLIQLLFGFLPNETILVHRHLLENSMTLEEVGCLGKYDDPILTSHVIRNINDEFDNFTNDEDIQEFSHNDFILAMQMLGKEVSVSGDRLREVRKNPPRNRPAFLDVTLLSKSERKVKNISLPPPPPGMPGAKWARIYDPIDTIVCQIFKNGKFGLRREGCDVEFSIKYPGISDPFPYWDTRLPEKFNYSVIPCGVGEVCLELFYFGDFSTIDNKENFLVLVRQCFAEKCGISVETPLSIREAGCIYPLVACPIILSEMDAMELGERFFEDFGKKSLSSNTIPVMNTNVTSNNDGCTQQ